MNRKKHFINPRPEIMAGQSLVDRPKKKLILGIYRPVKMTSALIHMCEHKKISQAKT